LGECFSLMENKMKYGEFIHMNAQKQKQRLAFVVSIIAGAGIYILCIMEEVLGDRCISIIAGAGIYILFGVIGLLIVLSTLLLWGILNYHKEVKE